MRGFISKNRIIGLLSVLGVLLLWKGLAAMVGAEIILPPPEQAVLKLIALFKTGSFWSAVGCTVIRTGAGFFLSFFLGTAVGIAAGMSPHFYAALRPILQVIRSTPVLAVILLAVMWFTSDAVPVFVAFLMSFPVVCQNVIEGIRNVDRKLLEMAHVYRIEGRDILFHISIPAILPYLTAAATATLGLTWKVVIAAEVLSLPIHAVGTGMQFAQINLEAAEVFAWTIMAILLSFLSDALMKALVRAMGRKGRAAP